MGLSSRVLLPRKIGKLLEAKGRDGGGCLVDENAIVRRCGERMKRMGEMTTLQGGFEVESIFLAKSVGIACGDGWVAAGGRTVRLP